MLIYIKHVGQTVPGTSKHNVKVGIHLGPVQT